jgi:large subunit ribosomal protein L31
MKKDLHPKEYRLVVFKDITNGNYFITKSTARAKDKVEIEGVEYPMIKMEISSTSHGFYTGQTKLIDSAGRVDKFNKRYSSLKK